MKPEKSSIKCFYCKEMFVKWSKKGLKKYLEHLQRHKKIEEQQRTFFLFSEIYKKQGNEEFYQLRIIRIL